MNAIQKIGYGTAAVVLGATQAFAADGRTVFGQQRANELNLGGNTDGVSAVKTLILSFLGFVTLIAVAYALWAGWNIMTAGGDEEKVKKGRTTIIQVVIGIVVMWLAYTIVNLILSALAA